MIPFILLGFTVGFLVGLTGIGGGALMTPSLIFLGVEPLVAVGTDLLYATVTRIFGVLFYYKKGKIRFDIASRLFAGSLPAILLGSLLLRIIDKSTLNSYLTILLGAILVISSFLSLVKGQINISLRPGRGYLYFLGFTVGLTVQLTSVGAGVMVSFALMNLAKLSPREVVGVTIFYGLALSSFSALNYAFLGNVDYCLASFLIAGTLPGVYLGTHLSVKANKDNLKSAVNVIILIIGLLILLQRVI